MTRDAYQSDPMKLFVKRLKDTDFRFDVALMKRRMEMALRDDGYQRKEARRIVSLTMDAALNAED